MENLKDFMIKKDKEFHREYIFQNLWKLLGEKDEGKSMNKM